MVTYPLWSLLCPIAATMVMPTIFYLLSSFYLFVCGAAFGWCLRDERGTK